MDLLAKSNTGVLLFWSQWPPGTGPTDRIGLSDAHNHSARVTSDSYLIGKVRFADQAAVERIGSHFTAVSRRCVWQRVIIIDLCA
jgi:hypothetical protein